MSENQFEGSVPKQGRESIVAYAQAPSLSYPATIIVAVFSVVFFACIYYHSQNSDSIFPIVVNSIAIYALFTPMHEAVHGSFSKIKWIDSFCGNWCALFFLSPYATFRWAHLEHHRFTNVPGKDPDLWSGTATQPILLPFYWATQDLHYLWAFSKTRKAIRSRFMDSDKQNQKLVNSFDVINQKFLATYVVLALIIAGFWSLGYLTTFFWAWFVPFRIAGFVLAWVLDYIPHFPYSHTTFQNKYKASRILDKNLFTPLLLGQRLHLIHHLYPSVPFYRYLKVLNQMEGKILKEQTQAKDTAA